jgi:hypothetical protein
MYIVGFIKKSAPTFLLAPKHCTSVSDLHEWIHTVLNSDSFLLALDKPITIELLKKELDAPNALLLVDFPGYDVALMIGQADAIYANTEKFVNVDGIESYYKAAAEWFKNNP